MSAKSDPLVLRAHPRRRIVGIGMLLAAAGLPLASFQVHADKRQMRKGPPDCVIFADSSCVGPNAKATMVMPMPSVTPSMPGDSGGTTSNLPTGYTERVLSLNPGAISAEAFETLKGVGGWPVHSCKAGMAMDPGGGSYPIMDPCTDGRSFDAVITNACSGVFEKKLYHWQKLGLVHNGDSNYVQSIVASGYATCASAGSEFAYLVRDAGTSQPVPRGLSADQVRAYAAVTGTDAVSADLASANQLCKEYGATGVYGATTGHFNSCRNNTLSVYMDGAWTRRNACTAGNQRVDTITCSFPAH